MRNLTLRDLMATLLVGAVIVPFVGYSVRGSMPFVRDPRGMAGIGIAVAALIAENVWALLIPMVAGVVIVWALALAHDAGNPSAGRLVRQG